MGILTKHLSNFKTADERRSELKRLIDEAQECEVTRCFVCDRPADMTLFHGPDRVFCCRPGDYDGSNQCKVVITEQRLSGQWNE